ncbi:2OG-Fe(II) oxygenase [Mesorhizobium sp. M6A.T.Cr.TU.014.01.1.1]|nr:hypothetical protein EN885_27085 [Mesorhizobium sp. M6A.T.Cr.TU.014.01.1.1]
MEPAHEHRPALSGRACRVPQAVSRLRSGMRHTVGIIFHDAK